VVNIKDLPVQVTRLQPNSALHIVHLCLVEETTAIFVKAFEDLLVLGSAIHIGFDEVMVSCGDCRATCKEFL